VWINHGEILEKGLKNPIPEEKRDAGRRSAGPDRGERRPRRDGDRPRGDRSRRDGPGRNAPGGRPELPRAVNPRTRKAPPKPAPKAETAAPAESPQAETTPKND
jgi:small subunit ribosomal protein S3